MLLRPPDVHVRAARSVVDGYLFHGVIPSSVLLQACHLQGLQCHVSFPQIVRG